MEVNSSYYVIVLYSELIQSVDLIVIFFLVLLRFFAKMLF